MAMADRVCCPNALVLECIWRRRPRGNPGNHGIPKVVKLSKAEARWKDGVWIGSIEAAAEHLVGTPLGAGKARAVTALPDGQRFEAKAIDEKQGTPWRPPTEHRRTNPDEN